ncbi:MAG: group 1 truncated hemoglobin [candidate division Zixibacteria bacterium]|nr:group 1 truncated hemoglobin [candidate division Zixibacteria bacterium]
MRFLKTTKEMGIVPFLIFVFSMSYGLVHSQEHPTEHPTAKQTEKSLYERLGGAYSIATVVDDFIERLLVNDVLNSNPKINEARIRVPKAGLKYHVTALVCQVTGGSEQYTGRSMKEAHKHLNISEKEWKAMMDDFKESLDSFKVPEAEQKELFAIVESTKSDIVVKATK